MVLTSLSGSTYSLSYVHCDRVKEPCKRSVSESPKIDSSKTALGETG